MISRFITHNHWPMTRTVNEYTLFSVFNIYYCDYSQLTIYNLTQNTTVTLVEKHKNNSCLSSSDAGLLCMNMIYSQTHQIKLLKEL